MSCALENTNLLTYLKTDLTFSNIAIASSNNEWMTRLPRNQVCADNSTIVAQLKAARLRVYIPCSEFLDFVKYKILFLELSCIKHVLIMTFLLFLKANP